MHRLWTLHNDMSRRSDISRQRLDGEHRSGEVHKLRSLCRLLPYKSYKHATVGEAKMLQVLRVHRVMGESSVMVKTDLYQAAESAFQTILENRKALQKYIETYPEFLLALDPVTVSQPAPEIVLRMSRAAEEAGVGPMAAVAGALADLAADTMIAQGAGVAVVENGGEISARRDSMLNVAINSGKSSLSGTLGLRVYSGDLPLGLATSSGTVGHALSFGFADSATVIAENAALADAAALGRMAGGQFPVP